MTEFLEDIEYHGFQLRSGYNGASPGFSSHSCFVYRENDQAFTIVVKMGVILAMTEYHGKDDEQIALLRATAIGHCTARIDLQRFKQGTVYEVLIGEPRTNPAADDLTQTLMDAYKNLRQLCPRDYRRQRIDIDGLVIFLDVSTDDVARALNDLLDEGLIATSGDPADALAAGAAYVTAKGLQFARPVAALSRS